MKEMGFLIGLSIFILTIWYIAYQEREYCENKGLEYIEGFIGGECK